METNTFSLGTIVQLNDYRIRGPITNNSLAKAGLYIIHGNNTSMQAHISEFTVVKESN